MMDSRIKFNAHTLLFISIIITPSLFAAETIETATHLATVITNADTCEIQKKYNLGICILNNTDRELNSNDIHLGEIASSEDDYFRADGNILYGSLSQNKYLILETTKARIQRGDTLNHIPYSQVEYTLRTTQDKRFAGCDFIWHVLTPPYPTPPVLIVTMKNDTLNCHFAK